MFQGSLTGPLFAGDLYKLIINASMSTVPVDSSQPITGNGSVTFNIIPEPSTALLVGLGLAGLAGARRRLS